jgi:O-antigen/teichoic acid export membrane protein
MLLYVCFVAGLALLGKPALLILFGHKFEPAGPFLVLLGIMQGIRLVRAVPAITAMAAAETKNPLYTNIIRGIFIPVALLVALAYGNIYWMLYVGIAGEAIAALASAWLLRRTVGLAARQFIVTFSTATMCAAAIAAIALDRQPLWLLGPPLLLFLFTIRHLLSYARNFKGG